MTECDEHAKLRSELAAIIEERLPKAADEIPVAKKNEALAEAIWRSRYSAPVVEWLKLPYRGLCKRSEYHAVSLIQAQKFPLSRFDRMPPADWSRLIRAAVALQDALDALGEEGRYLLNLNTPEGWSLSRSKGWNAPGPLADVACAIASAIKTQCPEMQAESRKDTARRRKSDWPALAVADAARIIWAQEKWYEKPEIYGSEPVLLPAPDNADEQAARQRLQEYLKHLDECAPRSDRQYKPGPFGRFLEDVLKSLDVDTKIAADALRSLKKVKDDDRAQYLAALLMEEPRTVPTLNDYCFNGRFSGLVWLIG
jgi:hypothetical protein